MSAINRRSLVGGFLCGAVAGLALTPGVVNAMPFDERVADNPDELDREGSSRRLEFASCASASTPVGLLVA